MLTEIVKLIEDERARQDAKHGGKAMDSKRTAGDWAHYVHKQALTLHDVQTSDQFKKQATKIAALGVAMLELVCRDSPADHTYEAKPIVVDKTGSYRCRNGLVVEVTELNNAGDFPVDFPVRGVEGSEFEYDQDLIEDLDFEVTDSDTLVVNTREFEAE